MGVHPDERPANAATALAQLRGVINPVPSAPVVVTVAAQGLGDASESPPRWRISLPHIRMADVGVGLALVGMCVFCYLWLVRTEAPQAIPSLPPTGRQALLSRLGEPVVVEGVIKEVTAGKVGGFRHLHFEGASEQDLSLVFFSTESPVEQMQRLSEFVGHKVRVTGKVSEQNGVPQIFIDSFSQLETL
jgi:hypothetical protein